MKAVYYIRHAKSSWAELGLADIDRPLNKRGNRDAPIMAIKLKELISSDESFNVENSIILSSSAQRTIETLAYFKNEFELRSEQIVIDEALYLSDSEYLIDSLFQLDDSINYVFLFAHNPGITDLANQCRISPINNIPTCGIFKVDFNVTSWTEVSTVVANSTVFIFPKMFV